MAAYPFGPGIRWSEFRSKLISDFNVEEETLELDGEDLLFIYRQNGSGRVRYNLPLLFDDNEFLMPSVVRSICVSLKIDPRAFGYNLG